MASFAQLMKGPDRKDLHVQNGRSIYQQKDVTFRQVGWIIAGGPRDGEFLPWGDEPTMVGVPHGSYSPVYMEVE